MAIEFTPSITATCHFCGGHEMLHDYYSDCIKCTCGAIYTFAGLKNQHTLFFSPTAIFKATMTREHAIALNNGA